MQTVRFVDLFAGIGGIRLAFEQASESLNIKPECVLSSEINSDSRLVYQENFGEIPKGDIQLIDKLPEHEVLLAGFPCQAFSHAGKKEGFGDTRGTLFFEIISKPVPTLLPDYNDNFSRSPTYIFVRGLIFLEHVASKTPRPPSTSVFLTTNTIRITVKAVRVWW